MVERMHEKLNVTKFNTDGCTNTKSRVIIIIKGLNMDFSTTLKYFWQPKFEVLSCLSTVQLWKMF